MTTPLVGIGGALEMGRSAMLMLSLCGWDSGMPQGRREDLLSGHTVRWGRLFPARAPPPGQTTSDVPFAKHGGRYSE